jgi:predicted transcriptional regulator
MATTTVRIPQPAHETLKVLAREAGEPMSAVLVQAIEQYRRKRFLEQMNVGFAALRADPKAWQEELEERRAWEATLMDDLTGTEVAEE